MECYDCSYAQNGRSNKALELFKNMLSECCEPNEVTLVSVMSACAQLGSVEVGERIGSFVENMSFNSSVYTIIPFLICMKVCRVFDEMSQKDIYSWNSMIGGLAYNGLTEDAINLYYKMIEESLKPNEITFVGLLTCMDFSNQLFFLIALLLSISSITHSADLITKERGQTFTNNDIVQGNINSVILNLLTKTNANGFTNSTYGFGNDTVYSLVECCGVISGHACSTCIIDAGQEM